MPSAPTTSHLLPPFVLFRSCTHALTRQVVLRLIVPIPNSPMMLNVIVLFDGFVNLIKCLEDENINSPGNHRTYALLPVTRRVLYIGDRIPKVLATSRPVGLAHPEIEIFILLNLLDMVKCLYLILAK